MKPAVEAAAKAYESLSKAILASTTENRPYNIVWGWNLPPITRTELAELPSRFAARLRTLPDGDVTKEVEDLLKAVPERATQLQNGSIGNLPGPNAIHVVPQIYELVDVVERALPPRLPPKVSVDWREADEKKLLPPDLLRRLRSIEASLRNIEPRTGKLAEQVAAIEAAHAAAESLPTDLATLGEARAEIDEARTAAKSAAEEIETARTGAEEARGRIAENEKESAQLVKNCGEAYRVTTTKGLAAAFHQRAFWLNVSLVLWIIGLLVALSVAAYMATQRLTLIQELMRAGASSDRLWVHVALAILSVGAPVWFAWIATKQIGQRFRLAEDYAFKASVAKAYEGYRREAARIDPQFEARLFGSALTRLEEAPLRFVESEIHGSPWHELTSSPAFEKALSLVPELKSKYLSLVPAALRGKSGNSPVEVAAATE